MKTNHIGIILALLVTTLLLSACSGGSSDSSSGGSIYSLNPTSIPISQKDKLVTVTVTQGTTQLTWLDKLKEYFLPAWYSIIPTAYATQITPTLSTLATAKIVSGQVTLVNPTFSTTVDIPDPANPNKTIETTVSLVCDTSSIPTTVHVNSAWALNYSSGDILVNMDYPISVSATYDNSTNTFSGCSFNNSSGYFIVYGDGSVSSMLDSTLGESPQSGCVINGYTPMRVIAAGDPSRNPTNTPILNSLFDTSFATASGYNFGPLCGSVRALSYSKLGGQTITKINFSNDILPNNTSIVADSANIYAIGSDRNYGGYATNATCPISVTQIGNAGSTCITLPNVSNYISYPVSATQLQTAGIYGTAQVQKPYPSLFIGSSGAPVLSLQTYSGLCNIGACFGQGSIPTLFNIDPTLMTSSIMATTAFDTSGYPWGMTGQVNPIGISNGYLMFGNPGNGLLVNISTGNVIHTCSNLIYGTDHGCSEASSFGNYVYGFVGCAYQGSSPNVCINIPAVDVTNTLSGVTNHWDLSALGYLPVTAMSNASNTISLPVRPIFDTDQVTFLACPSPNLACSSPNWVSLNFTTGQISPITTGGITFNQIPTLIGTSLW